MLKYYWLKFLVWVNDIQIVEMKCLKKHCYAIRKGRLKYKYLRLNKSHHSSKVWETYRSLVKSHNLDIHTPRGMTSMWTSYFTTSIQTIGEVFDYFYSTEKTTPVYIDRTYDEKK